MSGYVGSDLAGICGTQAMHSPVIAHKNITINNEQVQTKHKRGNCKQIRSKTPIQYSTLQVVDCTNKSKNTRKGKHKHKYNSCSEQNM